jgi:L,D-peptidoglycan transpeptidase YkuD (ErfK/YbiS/YcfS/YnhG family)
LRAFVIDQRALKGVKARPAVREVEHSGLKEQATVGTYTILWQTRMPSEKSMKRPSLTPQILTPRALSLIRVRTTPGNRTRGVVLAGGLAIPVVLGRTGIRANKREGDGGTPRGCFRLRRLWWRPDRSPRPPTLLPVSRIDGAVAWCEDTHDRRYNRPFRRSASEPGDRLWRDDHLYDWIIEIDHNTRPRIAGRGSAVFLHVARPNRGPTAGCVAFAPKTLRRLLASLGPKTRIEIQ